MSSDRLKRIQADLQRARTVIYLEGKTDEPLLFALAGVTRPSSGIHNDVYVVGLKTGGSGGKEVSALIDTAKSVGLAGTPGNGGVFGIIDGDGADLSSLKARFDAPYCGPLFSWPAYCIENLLTITWPSGWGVLPNWAAVLTSYVPYASLNRVHVELRSALKTLGLERFHAPTSDQALKTLVDIKTALSADKGLIAGCDVEAMFDAEVRRLNTALSSSLEEGHALVNGKWLITHYARITQPEKQEDVLRDMWARALLANGGHPTVRDLWTRIAGSAP